MDEGKTQEAAAAAAGMSVRSAREWQTGSMPLESREARTWRTREDPFEGVWASTIEPLLGRDLKEKLEAKTLLEEGRRHRKRISGGPPPFQPSC